MSFETKPTGDSDPSPGDDPVTEIRRLLVIDLVTQNHPSQDCLITNAGCSLPMCNRDILHPAKISNVVDMTKLVDISWLDRDWEFEGLRSLLHVLQYAILHGRVRQLTNIIGGWRLPEEALLPAVESRLVD